MSLLTCRDFLIELNDFLDKAAGEELRKELESHLEACPNCWVICDTTKKTVEVYKGADLYPLPEGVHTRLMTVLAKKISGQA